MTKRKGKPKDVCLSSLRLIRENAGDADCGVKVRTRIRSPRDAFVFMKPHTDIETTEVFWILALDSQSRVLFNSPIVITRGLLNSSLVHPREVFRSAIAAGAAGILLVHNHPSGEPTPSPEDRAVTRQLLEAGRLLALPIYDHVIVAGERYVSFAELGLI